MRDYVGQSFQEKLNRKHIITPISGYEESEGVCVPRFLSIEKDQPNSVRIRLRLVHTQKTEPHFRGSVFCVCRDGGEDPARAVFFVYNYKRRKKKAGDTNSQK